MKDDFVNIVLESNNTDRYYHRKSIFEAIKKNLKYFKGRLLDAGCGKMPYRSYILSNSNVMEYVGIDIENAINYSDTIKPDLIWDGVRMPLNDESFDCVLSTEVLEHVPYPIKYLSEVFRVLKKEGIFFFTVPFLWPLHETPHDEYRYTPFAIERLLKEAGFSSIQIEASGGWNASLGQMLGLWLKRGPMPRRKKKLIRIIVFPILKYLFAHDDAKVDFLKGPMITGFSGIAYKK